jgi:hypothetical protein
VAGLAPRAGEAYLGAMRMFNLGLVSPRDGIGDLISYWRQPTPYRWQLLGLAVALTFTMLVLFIPKAERVPPAQPNIIYISSWPENRSEKEIIASNIANQKRKDALAAAEKQRAEIRKEFYRELARASGMDPDELAKPYADKDTTGESAKAKAPADAGAAAAKPAQAQPPAPAKSPSSGG